MGANIAAGFFIVGGLVALIAGYLADIWNRTLLLGWIVVAGSTASGCTYFVQTYQQLFFVRILTGISIGGASPVVYSMLGDLYQAEERVMALTWVTVASTFGISAGQLIAGLMGPDVGWR